MNLLQQALKINLLKPETLTRVLACCSTYDVVPDLCIAFDMIENRNPGVDDQLTTLLSDWKPAGYKN